MKMRSLSEEHGVRESLGNARADVEGVASVLSLVWIYGFTSSAFFASCAIPVPRNIVQGWRISSALNMWRRSRQPSSSDLLGAETCNEFSKISHVKDTRRPFSQGIEELWHVGGRKMTHFTSPKFAGPSTQRWFVSQTLQQIRGYLTAKICSDLPTILIYFIVNIIYICIIYI